MTAAGRGRPDPHGFRVPCAIVSGVIRPLVWIMVVLWVAGLALVGLLSSDVGAAMGAKGGAGYSIHSGLIGYVIVTLEAALLAVIAKPWSGLSPGRTALATISASALAFLNYSFNVAARDDSGVITAVFDWALLAAIVWGMIFAFALGRASGQRPA